MVSGMSRSAQTPLGNKQVRQINLTQVSQRKGQRLLEFE